jgi:hypothetical protein
LFSAKPRGDIEKTEIFIDNALKNDDEPLDPVPEIINKVAELYVSDFFFAKNNLADNPTEHPVLF